MRNNEYITCGRYLPIVLILMVTFLFGCVPDISPSLSDVEKQELEDHKYPFAQSTIYADALEQMGRAINETISYQKVIQPMNIGNTAGGTELPYNLTNMVINSVSEFAGSKVVVVPNDPNFIIADAQTGGKGTRALPDLLIGGSITEFDKDVEGNSSSINLDLLISHQGTEADIGLGAGRSRKLSRVVIDLYLLDYATHAVIPGVNVSNSVHVLELDKENDFGFAIWGSGMGIEGRIARKQGFHKAVRNLVEYSILQLFGKYYDLPYWKLLGMKQSDPDVMRNLNKAFASKTHKQQIYEIQQLLDRYNFGPVVNPADGITYYHIPVDGTSSPLTQAYIDNYIKRYSLTIPNNKLDALYISLIANGPFPGVEPVRQSAGLDANTSKTTMTNQYSIGTTHSMQTAVIYHSGGNGEILLVAGNTLRSGDKYKIVVQPEQDCYLYVFQRDSAGQLFPLFPRHDQKSMITNPIKGDVVYEFPGDRGYFFLDKQQGEEHIIFYSTAEPDPLIEKNLRLMAMNLSDDEQRKVEKQLLAHFAQKEIIDESGHGEELVLNSKKGGPLRARMNKVQKLSNNTVYIFPFHHQ